MKNILFSLLALFMSLNFMAAQVEWPPVPCPEDQIQSAGTNTNLTLNKDVAQSSYLTDGTGMPSLAVDGVIGTLQNQSSQTGREKNPWWEVDLEQKSRIKSLQIWYSSDLYPGGLQGYYIFFSEHPLYSNSLEENLVNPVVRHIYLGNSPESGSALPIENIRARYVRIQKDGIGTIGFYEVMLLGVPDPPGPEEICDNGIDDDGDCLIDCADPDCRPHIWNVTAKNPTCNDCMDGEIKIKSHGNNLEYSIDDGATYTTCPPTGEFGECLFTGLGAGDYLVKVRKGACETGWKNKIELRGPEGDPSLSACPNGDFELGTSQFWTGTRGNNVNGNYVISQIGITNFAASSLHQIHSTGNWTDPLLNIPINAPLGTYFARAGSLVTGTNEGGSLRYCLTVDQSNVQNYFWYFMVMEDGGHAPNLNPFFQYRILNNSGVVLQAFPPVIADVNNPFFKLGGGGVVYKDWTCQPLNLSNFIGQQICIEFIAANCVLTGHRGYVYIDGLCTEPPQPYAELVTPPDVYCLDQSVDIQVQNEFLINRYQWRFARLDASNTPFDPLVMPIQIGNSIPDFIDLLGVYQQTYPNYTFDCSDKFRVELLLLNDCSDLLISKEIRFSCNAYDLDYPDIMVCNGNQDVVITGTSTCDGCTFQWSIEHDPHNLPNTAGVYLSSTTSPTPTILGTLNVYAFDMIYKVTLTTPEGCEYYDTVKIINMAQLKANIGDEATDICTFDSISNISYLFPIDWFKYFNIVYAIKGNYGQYPADTPFNNIPDENIPLEFLGEPDTCSDTIFFKPTLKRLLRGFKQNISITITPKPNAPGVRVINQNCVRNFNNLRESDSSLFGGVNIYVPNKFSPNAQSVQNQTIRPFFSNNVFEAWFKVFDRWGELVHLAHVKSPNDQALTVSQLDALKWDGTFQGQPMDAQVFVFVTDFQNCQVTPADCFSDNEEGIGPEGIIAPQPKPSDPNLYFPFRAIARGAKVTANTSTSEGNNQVFNCGYFISPSNLIINYDFCPNILSCSDAAHVGDFTLIY